MIKKRKKQHRPLAAGESGYDFSGAKVNSSIDFFNWVRVGEDGVVVDTSDTNSSENEKKNSGIKTILYVSLGAIALTGILIFALGRRKK